MDLPQIPVELQHHIISFLEAPQDILKCALVCRSWLTSGRATSFPLYSAASNANIDLSHLLEHPLSTLPQHLSSISINFTNLASGHPKALQVLKAYKVRIQDMIVVFNPARREDAHFRYAVIDFITSMSTSLRMIAINRYSHSSVASLLNAISKATSLTLLLLYIDGAEFSRTLPEPVTAFAPAKLQSIRTNYIDPSLMEKWTLGSSDISFALATWNDVFALRDFLLRPGFEQACQWVTFVLRIDFAIGGNVMIEDIFQSPYPVGLLTSLDQTIYFDITPSVDFNLQNCINLRSLTLTTVVATTIRDVAPISDIFRSLSTIPKPQIPKFTLRLTLIVSTQDQQQLDLMINKYVGSVLNMKQITVTLKIDTLEQKLEDYAQCVAQSKAASNFTFDVSSYDRRW